MTYFVVTLGLGPEHDPCRPQWGQDGFDGHAVFMDALVAEGIVLLGGPLGDDVDTGDVLQVFYIDDETPVRAVLKAGSVARQRVDH